MAKRRTKLHTSKCDSGHEAFLFRNLEVLRTQKERKLGYSSFPFTIRMVTALYAIYYFGLKDKHTRISLISGPQVLGSCEYESLRNPNFHFSHGSDRSISSHTSHFFPVRENWPYGWYLSCQVHYFRKGTVSSSLVYW